MSTELITIEQLPIIKENLRAMSEEIQKSVNEAMSLVCNEETVKSVKNVRSDLNNQFKSLEEQRKTVKNAVLAPYEAFECVYKEYVSGMFKAADADLKCKIDDVENGLKLQKSEEVKAYFGEYAKAKNIDFLTFERAGIQATLSASLKSLKADVKTFLDKVSDELALIDTQENKAEILVEYKNTLNVAGAITIVSRRHEAIEAERKRQEEISAAKAAVQPISEVRSEPIKMDMEPTPVAPYQAVNSSKLKVSFEFNISRHELAQLRAFLADSGIEYKEGEFEI